MRSGWMHRGRPDSLGRSSLPSRRRDQMAPGGLSRSIRRAVVRASARAPVEMVQTYIGDGRALLIWSVRSEQRFAVASLGHEREPIDIEGCTVMRSSYRAAEGWTAIPGAVKPAKESWSIAARRRRFRNSAERSLGQQ